MIYLLPQRRGSRKKAEMTDLQKHIEIMRRLCRKLDETGLGLKRRSNGKLDTLVSFETDVLLFMIALSNGDGQIDEDETLAISENLGLKLSESQIHRFVERQNLSDYRLQDADIPLTMQVLVDADTEIMQREMDSYRDGTAPQISLSANGDGPYVPISILLYNIYQEVGASVIYSNNEVDAGENEEYNSYLAALRKYIEDELSYDEDQFASKLDILGDDNT